MAEARHAENGKHPIRILHVVQSMDRGGLETWLLNVMRRIDRTRFQFDFCPAVTTPAAYDPEIRDLGGGIYPCRRDPGARGSWRFVRSFRELLKSRQYDVVHAHPRLFAGVILRVAEQQGVANRFAHVHTDTDAMRSTPARVLYRKFVAHLVRKHATLILGGTRGVFQSFFGDSWQNDPRMRVVRYGIDLDPFEGAADRTGLRAELGLPPESVLLIHIGRFVEAKNHRGLIEIFRTLRNQRSDVHLLLVGSQGALLDETRALVRESGLTDSAHFLGARSDLGRLLKSADLFLLPSTREGMPLVMLEATAAGLPVIASDLPGTREANEVCCDGRLIPVGAAPDEWVEAIQAVLSSPRADAAAMLRRMKESPFSSDVSARTMEEIYAACVRGERLTTRRT